MAFLHNAGILGERTELENYPVDVWDDVMAVNLRAPFVGLTQELMPLLKNRHASVVLPVRCRTKRVNVGAHIPCLRSPLKRSANYLPKKIPHRHIRFNCINPGRPALQCVQKPILMKIQNIANA